MRCRSVGPGWVLLLVLSACSGNDVRDSPDGGQGADASQSDAAALWDPGPNPYAMDDVLRVNHIQARATHNSYHMEPASPVADSHRYTHAPLDVQLDAQGVRGLELDLHYRSTPEFEGFEVFHLPAFDDQSTCQRFVDCLQLLKAWSDSHPWHLPLMVWLEPKDEDADAFDDTLLPIEGRYDALEAEILEVWPRSRILAPDDVRGDHVDLPSALASDGWPTLGDARNKIMFALLDSGTHRDAYVSTEDNLAGKLLFVDASDPADAYAAMFKDANPQDGRALVEAGFLVTTNVAGADTPDADAQAELEATLPSGMHFLADDTPAPVEDRSYFLDIPDGQPARCNPVTAPAGCTSVDVEDL